MNYKLWIEGEWKSSQVKSKITSPFNQEVLGESDQASAEQIEEATAAAVHAFTAFKKTSRLTRSRLLSRLASEIEKNRAKFVEKLIHEAGKPRTLSEVEVTRAINTFSLASEEAKRFGGEVIPLDIEGSSTSYAPAVSLWVPRGPILAIAPFNFPLNLVAHKVAPALAIGASIIVKPPPQAPGCSFLLAEIFQKLILEIPEVPAASFQVVCAQNEVIAKAVTDSRLSILSFTGSDRVGWMLQGQAMRKKVLLELGGNAATIIHHDADIKRAAQRCASGGFGYAGQTCISVQRIFVHADIEASFTGLLLDEIAKLKCGDPSEKDTIVGPLIDAKAADRVESWVEEAKKSGARVLKAGVRQGNVISPIVLTGVPRTAKVSCEEVFGPVVIIESFHDFNEALTGVNDSRFGLQAGIFTDSALLIRKAFETLEVGAVIINDIPSFRADHMPYGGVKDSGLGREGLKYAMEDYSERRTLISWNG